ncbi:MAG: VOC family protein [Chloroflexi bacterium]|nr:VOC family protein [Chloroflexota bacterium]
MGATPERQPAAGEPLVRPAGLDHANLHVRDVEASLRFYTEVLGLTAERRPVPESGTFNNRVIIR